MIKPYFINLFVFSFFNRYICHTDQLIPSLMKKFFTIRLHLLAILAAITIVSCTSDTVDTEPVIPVTPQTRAIPTPTFDWANAEWMPVPAGQSAIPSPWNGAGSISYTYGMDITNDRYPNAGWELLYNTFDAMRRGRWSTPISSFTTNTEESCASTSTLRQNSSPHPPICKTASLSFRITKPHC